MKSSQLNKAISLVRRTGDKMVIFDQESDAGFALLSLDQYEDLLNEADWVAPDDEDDNFDPKEFLRSRDWSADLPTAVKAPWEEPWEDDDEEAATEFSPASDKLETPLEPEWGSEEKNNEEIKLSDNFVPELSEEEPIIKPAAKTFSTRSGFEHVGAIASRKLNEVLPELEDDFITDKKIDAGVLEEVSLADVPHEEEEETFLLEPVE